MQLDEWDKLILRQLQQNNRLTSEQIGAQVNLSQSAVQRRITRMREEKIIEADVSIISQQAGGIGITTIVNIALHEGNSSQIESFKRSMSSCEEVSQCYYVTGNYDFVVVVNTRDMAHFEEFSKRMLMDHPNMKHFYTNVVMDRVKVGFAVVL